jgi:hypothetical protein
VKPVLRSYLVQRLDHDPVIPFDVGKNRLFTKQHNPALIRLLTINMRT